VSKLKLICVTGPDGSGKTTQIGKLAERLERRGKKKIAAVTIWDMLLDPATRGKLPFRSPTEVDGVLQVLHTMPRTLFLYHCFAEALEMAKERHADICLINSYWYKYYATEVAHGGNAERIRRIADDVFDEPTLTFYLRITPEEAFNRKATLSGYETGFANPRSQEAFIAFQNKAHAALNEMAAQRRWIEMDGKESIEALTDMILARIDQGEQ